MDFFQIYKLNFQMGSQHCQVILRHHPNIFTVPFSKRTAFTLSLISSISNIPYCSQLMILLQASQRKSEQWRMFSSLPSLANNLCSYPFCLGLCASMLVGFLLLCRPPPLVLCTPLPHLLRNLVL